MSFSGYRFKFELHASHSNLQYPYDDVHYHNFTISLFINKIIPDDELFLFDDVADLVKQWLEQYQGKHLGDMVLFHNTDTTIESIGDIFYTLLKEKMQDIGFLLLRLEIYENPTRVYSVSEKLLDSQVNELNTIPFQNTFTREAEEHVTEHALSEHALDMVNELPKEKEEHEETEELREAKESNRIEKINKTDENVIHYKTTVTAVPKNKFAKIIKLLLGIFTLFVSALAVMYIIKDSGVYPCGSDTLCHIYRADLVLQSIKNGILYPLYDANWYNGVEIMRYWAPLPLYMLAFLQFVANGIAFDGYILLIGLILFAGGCGWLLFGWKYDRLGLATFVGIIWFFLPENMRLLIMDGNLPRGVINILLPYLLYFVWDYIEEERWSSIMPIMLVTSLIALCHVGIAAMVLVSIILYAVIHAIYKKDFKLTILLIIGMIISFMIIGIWLIPALHGGAVSGGNAMNQVMQSFFKNGFKSLNPKARINGNIVEFYYGVSIFVICILGFAFGNKKIKPGFLAAILIFFSTTKSIFSIFINLPFSQFLWMIRFIPVSLALAMMSLLLWNNLKKSFLGFLCIILILDVVPSYYYIHVRSDYIFSKDEFVPNNVEASQHAKADSTYINQSKAITTQRMVLFDLNTYEAFAPYYISGVEPKVSSTFGAGWEGAKTASNIVQINSALTNGNYLYLFDRCMQLGNDTALFRVGCLKNKAADINLLIEAGKQLGYEFVDRGENSLVFHKDVDYSFGIVSKYNNIAIGESAKEIALMFPSFKEGNSSNLDDYSVEQLKDYKNIYLSGFTYGDKDTTEKKLTELANSGVKIYIDMNKIPVDTKTNRHQMFNVSAQVIAFQDTYPELYYNGLTYQPEEFLNDSEEYTDDLTNWNTVYLDGIKNKEGYCNLNGKEVVFAGTNDNSNIYFLGFNLLYHVQTSNDEDIKKLLESIFAVSTTDLPQREIVPIDIDVQADNIIIKTKSNSVNTTLSYLDIFHSQQQVSEENNLLVVNKGTTIIQLNYPYFKEGLTLSIAGILLLIIFLILSYKYSRKRVLKTEQE